MKNATDFAMGPNKTKVLHKNLNGHKVIEENGWIKVLYANGDTRAKIPTQDLKWSGISRNGWVHENTR